MKNLLHPPKPWRRLVLIISTLLLSSICLGQKDKRLLPPEELLKVDNFDSTFHMEIKKGDFIEFYYCKPFKKQNLALVIERGVNPFHILKFYCRGLLYKVKNYYLYRLESVSERFEKYRVNYERIEGSKELKFKSDTLLMNNYK